MSSVETSPAVGFQKSVDDHRLLAGLRSRDFGHANPVRRNHSDLAYRAADAGVRNGSRCVAIRLDNRGHWLTRHFALASRVRGASHPEKVPIASRRLDSDYSLASIGRADFHSLRSGRS